MVGCTRRKSESQKAERNGDFGSGTYGSSPTLGATLDTLPSTCPRLAAHGAAPSRSATGDPVTLTAADLDSWLGRFMPCAAIRREVSGAVVVVVKDNQILFAKGYGYADRVAHRSVDPETTLFRVASISKLFT